MKEFYEYLDLAKQMHKVEDKWPGMSLVEHLETIDNIIEEHNIETSLDYGCGKARFHPLNWNFDKYDPAVPEFSNKPKKQYDLVISTDVMEHIPRDGVDYVIEDIFKLAKKFVFVTVACRPAKNILPNGANAHVTVENEDWWEPKFKKFSDQYGVSYKVIYIYKGKKVNPVEYLNNYYIKKGIKLKYEGR